MEKEKYYFKSEDKFEDLNDLQKNLFQILQFELGYHFADKYEEAMDSLALSNSIKATNFYENYTAIIRKVKNCLNDKKVLNLVSFIAEQRALIKDDFMTYKTKRNLSIVIDILENINKSSNKLIYDILQEVKAGYLKRTKSPYLILEEYFDLNVKKKYESMQGFINETLDNSDKVINLAYGGI